MAMLQYLCLVIHDIFLAAEYFMRSQYIVPTFKDTMDVGYEDYLI
jgi:hypothetical protein